jgi:transcriptional regulator with XRE-family HTH domain
MTGPAALNPTIRRRRLGRELRRLRVARSLRLEDVAAHLGVAPSTLSRIETGQAPTRTSYLKAMLELYQLDDPEQSRFLTDLAREAQRKPWWTGHAGLLPAHAGPYLDLEALASRARIYCTQILPGLLQTGDYTTAACRAVLPGYTAGQVRILQAIQARRQELARNAGLSIHLVVEESVLLTPVGGGTVMAGQLRQLLTFAADPAITIQVAQLSRARPVISLPFTALDFTDPADPSVVCYGVVAGEVIFTTSENHVSTAQAAFTSLSEAALPGEASAELIKDLAGRYGSQKKDAANP